jgi:hypothetical protein
MCDHDYPTIASSREDIPFVVVRCMETAALDVSALMIGLDVRIVFLEKGDGPPEESTRKERTG